MPENKINDLLKALDKAIEQFNSSLDVIQNDVLAKVEIISKQIDLSGQNVKPSVNNLKLINELKEEVSKAVVSPEYKNKVIEFGKAFNTVEKIQNEYFSALVEEFSAPAVLKEVKNLAIRETVESLTESGIRVNVSDRIGDILKTNIESGSKYTDMVKELKNFITGTEETVGVLQNYASTITTDAINEYSATYTQIVSDNLGLDWFTYAGALVEGSREVCEELIKKKFIHKSEFAEILKGHVNGKSLTLSKKTGLPLGMKAGTTVDNLRIKRGGWKCNHLYMPTTEERVPQKYKDKINA
jgi:hypothetical protein